VSSRNPFGKLRQRARELGTRAVDELLSSEQRAEAVGNAVKKLQEARTVLDQRGGRVLAAMGLATAPDLDRVSRKIGRLRKRLNRVIDRLDEMQAAGVFAAANRKPASDTNSAGD